MGYLMACLCLFGAMCVKLCRPNSTLVYLNDTSDGQVQVPDFKCPWQSHTPFNEHSDYYETFEINHT